MSALTAALTNTRSSTSLYRDTADVIRRLEPTEPLYLFCERALRSRVVQFQRGFPGTISYAVKANPEPRVLKALLQNGIGHFDVASLGEIETVAALAPSAVLHFNNPVKAAEAIEKAYVDFGVRSFALDELSEFDKIKRATGGDSNVVYSVRFKLDHSGASYDFGSKFGATPAEAIDLMQAIARVGARPALTFHPGSQCTDPGMYACYLQAAADIIRCSGVEPEQVNVGGGFPERYHNSSAPDLQKYFDRIVQASRQCFTRAPALMCEPGRGMVASAVSLLARVIHVRDKQHGVFINDGLYGGMQEQSLVDLELPLKPWCRSPRLRQESARYQVFGPTCDPVDRLSRTVELPAHIRTGDYLEFGLLGAYGSATATGFNGFGSTTYTDVEQGFLPAAGAS